MRLENRKMAGTRGTSNHMTPKPAITLVIRQQTNEEQHWYQSALDALLLEMVRQQIGRGRK